MSFRQLAKIWAKTRAAILVAVAFAMMVSLGAVSDASGGRPPLREFGLVADEFGPAGLPAFAHPLVVLDFNFKVKVPHWKLRFNRYHLNARLVVSATTDQAGAILGVGIEGRGTMMTNEREETTDIFSTQLPLALITKEKIEYKQGLFTLFAIDATGVNPISGGILRIELLHGVGMTSARSFHLARGVDGLWIVQEVRGPVKPVGLLTVFRAHSNERAGYGFSIPEPQVVFESAEKVLSDKKWQGEHRHIGDVAGVKSEMSTSQKRVDEFGIEAAFISENDYWYLVDQKRKTEAEEKKGAAGSTPTRGGNK